MAEDYKPQKHEWGTDASVNYATELTPGQKKGKPKKYSSDVKESWQQLEEAFNNPYKFKLQKSGKDYYSISELDDGSNLNIRADFEYDDPLTYQFLFSRGGSYSKSGEGDAMRIFATVMSAFEKFVKKESPDQILFHAAKDEFDGETNPQSREKLYSRLILRFAKKMGYTSDDFFDTTGTSFYLVKEGLM